MPLKSAVKKTTEDGLKKPRLCRVNHLFEPVAKWAPNVAASGFPHSVFLRNGRGHAHRGQVKAPGSQVLAQKTNVNHAHRRG